MICQHCGATVPSTSQPERMGAMPELRDVLMLARDFIDYELPISGKLVVSEIDAALAATPAVGGETRDKIATIIGGQHYADFEEDACGCSQCDAEREACRKLADQAIVLAAQPATPLRGRESSLRDALGEIAGKNDLSGVSVDDLASAAFNALHECELIARNALSASPPEQPAAQLTDEMINAGTAAMIASDTPDGPSYVALARACLSAALGVDVYVAHEAAATPTEDLKE